MQGGNNQAPRRPSFVCRFDVLEAVQPRKDIHGRHVPPERRQDQRCTKGSLFRWNGTSWEGPLTIDDRLLQGHRTGTVWIQRQARNFFAFAADVTQIDIAEGDTTWSLLGFHNRNNMSCIDYTAEQIELQFLGNPNWMPQLLPAPYHPKPSRPRGGLIGKLPLVLGLFAYSGPLGDPASFLPQVSNGGWIPQQGPHSCEFV